MDKDLKDMLERVLVTQEKMATVVADLQRRLAAVEAVSHKQITEDDLRKRVEILTRPHQQVYPRQPRKLCSGQERTVLGARAPAHGGELYC